MFLVSLPFPSFREQSCLDSWRRVTAYLLAFHDGPAAKEQHLSGTSGSNRRFVFTKHVLPKLCKFLRKGGLVCLFSFPRVLAADSSAVVVANWSQDASKQQRATLSTSINTWTLTWVEYHLTGDRLSRVFRMSSHKEFAGGLLETFLGYTADRKPTNQEDDDYAQLRLTGISDGWSLYILSKCISPSRLVGGLNSIACIWFTLFKHFRFGITCVEFNPD